MYRDFVFEVLKTKLRGKKKTYWVKHLKDLPPLI